MDTASKIVLVYRDMERRDQNLIVEKYKVTYLHKFTLVTGSYVHLAILMKQYKVTYTI